MNNIIPAYLKAGDTIGIISPASIIDKQKVDQAAQLLRNMGYNVVYARHVFEKHNQFAGTDKQRTADLQSMIDDETVKAIICSRGGYGSLRTILPVDWSRFVHKPKWIVGFSDVTVLHSKLHSMHIASVHGVMPSHFVKNRKPSQSFVSMMDAIEGKNLHYEFSSSEYTICGETTAPVVGGNLSILYSLRGTPYDIDTDGKILFIEDLAEYLYHLDRIMMNLKTGGKLRNLAGLIVGGFTSMKDNDTPFGKNVEEIILDAVSGYGYPVAFNFQAGHQAINLAIKMGCRATLSINEQKGTFTQNK